MDELALARGLVSSEEVAPVVLVDELDAPMVPVSELLLLEGLLELTLLLGRLLDVLAEPGDVLEAALLDGVVEL